MNCNFTNPLRDEDDVVIGRRNCARAASYHIVYIGGSYQGAAPIQPLEFSGPTETGGTK
jgi:hypothetical protein